MATWRVSLREFPLVNQDVEGVQYARPAFEVARPLLEQKLADKFPDQPRRVLSFDDCNYRELRQPKAMGVRA
jgi:hypothetical protein